MDSILLPDFDLIDWRTYETLYSIDSLGEHWKQSEKLISDAAKNEELINCPNSPPTTEDEYAEYRGQIQMARYLQDEIMIPNLRYSTIVMIYIVFECELIRLKGNVQKSKGWSAIDSEKQQKGSVADRILKCLKVNYSIDLKSSPTYKKITDLQKVRDCIVHCAADVDLSRDKEYLIKFAKKRSDLNIGSGYPIQIKENYILASFSDLWQFFLHAFRVLNWEVNDEWLNIQWI